MSTNKYWPKYHMIPIQNRSEDHKNLEEIYEDMGDYLTVFIKECEERYRCEDLVVFKEDILGIEGELFHFHELKQKYENHEFYLQIPESSVLKVSANIVIKVEVSGNNYIDYEEFEKTVIDKQKDVNGEIISIHEFRELSRRFKKFPEEKDIDKLKAVFDRIPLYKVGFTSRMLDDFKEGIFILKEKYSHEDLYFKNGIDYNVC